MSKTIRQIADEIGVSKQSVQKRLSREPLCTSVAPYISTVDGVKYIAVDGEKLIKQAFFKSGIDNLSIDKNDVSIDKVDGLSIDKNDVSIDKNSDYTPIIEVLQATIDTLQGQLEVKDKQIEQLRAELAEERQHSRQQADKIAVIADQSQKLQLAQLASSSEQLSPIDDTQPAKLHWWQKNKNKKY